jgi:hypothetical protein
MFNFTAEVEAIKAFVLTLLAWIAVTLTNSWPEQRDRSSFKFIQHSMQAMATEVEVTGHCQAVEAFLK